MRLIDATVACNDAGGDGIDVESARRPHLKTGHAAGAR